TRGYSVATQPTKAVAPAPMITFRWLPHARIASRRRSGVGCSLPAFSMALRTHARAGAGQTRRATKRARPKILDASRMTSSEYESRRSTSATVDDRDPACYGLLPELARRRWGRSEDAATEEPKRRNVARTLVHNSFLHGRFACVKADARVCVGET